MADTQTKFHASLSSSGPRTPRKGGSVGTSKEDEDFDAEKFFADLDKQLADLD